VICYCWLGDSKAFSDSGNHVASCTSFLTNLDVHFGNPDGVTLPSSPASVALKNHIWYLFTQVVRLAERVQLSLGTVQ